MLLSPEEPLPVLEDRALRAWFAAVVRDTHPLRLAAAMRRVEEIACSFLPAHRVHEAMHAVILEELDPAAVGPHPSHRGRERSG